jgi:hypothetical protein
MIIAEKMGTQNTYNLYERVEGSPSMGELFAIVKIISGLKYAAVDSKHGVGLYVTNNNYLVTFGYHKHIADKKDAIIVQHYNYLTNS